MVERGATGRASGSSEGSRAQLFFSLNGKLQLGAVYGCAQRYRKGIEDDLIVPLMCWNAARSS
jgi:hypothetical protein